MRLTENRRIAAMVLLACVLVCVFALGGMKLKAKESALNDLFVLGSETDLATRHSMDSYLDRATDAANSLAQDAKQYSVEESLIGDVLKYAEALGKTDGMNGRYEPYASLTAAVETLYSALQAAGAGEEVNVRMAYGDFTSAQSLLKYDAYHAEANAYNKTVGAFPASVIAALWGVGTAETYGW
jgi:hypothetical protein